MRPSPLFMLTSCAVLAVTSTAPAATVDVPATRSAIQDALDASLPGDEIVVGPGVSHGQILFPPHDIVLRSRNGADVTVLDGDGGGSVVVIRDGQTFATHLKGFTVTGGRPAEGASYDRADFGTGVLIDTDSAATIVDCILRDNTSWYGGGMTVWGGSAEIFGCSFLSNTSTYTGGGGLMIATADLPLVVHNCTFQYNESERGGGAIRMINTDRAILTRCTMSMNEDRGSASDEGGGAMLLESSGVEMKACSVLDNHAENPGGGILVVSAAHLILRGCRIDRNITGEDQVDIDILRGTVSLADTYGVVARAEADGRIEVLKPRSKP
jgi:hypothetical protein